MEEPVKRKRGRPKKIKQEILEIVNDVLDTPIEQLTVPRTADEIINAANVQETEDELEAHKIIEEAKLKRKGEWDVKIDEPILFFDASLSYELSGYKPINDTQGLDFNPDWFTETREKYLKTGHYCQYPRKTKAYSEFWDEQYRRCRSGLTVNGYTITGDHYFFLNFYQLDDLTSAKKAGGGRLRSFPSFFVEQYKYFHYLELCKLLRKNCALMKARGVGQH